MHGSRKSSSSSTRVRRGTRACASFAGTRSSTLLPSDCGLTLLVLFLGELPGVRVSHIFRYASTGLLLAVGGCSARGWFHDRDNLLGERSELYQFGLRFLVVIVRSAAPARERLPWIGRSSPELPRSASVVQRRPSSSSPSRFFLGQRSSSRSHDDRWPLENGARPTVAPSVF